MAAFDRGKGGGGEGKEEARWPAIYTENTFRSGLGLDGQVNANIHRAHTRFFENEFILLFDLWLLPPLLDPADVASQKRYQNQDFHFDVNGKEQFNYYY